MLKISEQQYNYLADAFLECLYNRLLALNKPQIKELSFSKDVLEIEKEGVGKWVLNKNQASKQLWCSSPVSGPSRFDYSFDAKKWVNKKFQLLHKSHSLTEQLANELQIHLIN